MKNQRPISVIISGGGTGGHVYPALAIADAIKARIPDAQIRFVGAEGRLEMEKVPQYGYPIDGLPIMGINRSKPWKNILLPFKLLSSFNKVRKIIRTYRPDVAVGVGGYASGPMLFIASGNGIPCLIQEQNSFPGLTNKWLAKRVNRICVAYPGLEKFFPKEKIVFTGNPVRGFRPPEAGKRQEACEFFGLDASRPVVLVMGGSLGARTLNESLLGGLDTIASSTVQVIWQTGKVHYAAVTEALKGRLPNNIKVMPFIDRMDYAYAAATAVVSRAGAISISELSLVQKPCILVPSPNVAEDHQTKNALVLADAGAAIMVRDDEARQKLVQEMLDLAKDAGKQQTLADNIGRFARPNAADDIAEEILKLIK